MNKQHGGTLLGLIVGLVVGLAAALIVAVYVNKVPIPLMDRGVNRDRGNEAIEQERNKNWNPNAGLSSKPAPVPATPESTVPAEAEATPPPPAQPTDPLGELIQSQAQAPAQVPTVEAPPVPDPFNYFVQAGAFRHAEEAEAQRARLAMMGFDAKVSEREQAGRPVFRVRLGPFDKKADAEATQGRLTGQSIETALVRVQR
jgi:cell division protein FtsN